MVLSPLCGRPSFLHERSRQLMPSWWSRQFVLSMSGLVLAVLVTACSSTSPPVPRGRVNTHPAIRNKVRVSRARPLPAAAARGITKIKHVVIITQENRSFDSYFGTYPGARGLPATDRRPCLPNPSGPCVRPFHTRADASAGGPHSVMAAVADEAHGAMNGFLQQASTAQVQCKDITSPQCGFSAPKQVMGFYDQREIPNYWDYARQFVLQDRFFEATDAWSLPQHLYMLSAWSAMCRSHSPTSGCQGNQDLYEELPQDRKYLFFSWTDITYLLHAYGVSWRYYVEPGEQPDCGNDNRIVCSAARQAASKPSIWNPLPRFDTVRQDHQRRDILPTGAFFSVARQGRLPAVSWITPNSVDSEHPPARVSDGQAWVTNVINAIMKSPDWNSTAIFLNWDDWGGYYDGVKPVSVDQQGYGLRVPALVISPYARAGYIDHQTLSTDAYLKFIEDRWLDGQALNPKTDGRPDNRPDVREAKPSLGDLLNDFNFTQAPIPPLVMSPRPTTDLVEPPGLPPPTVQCTNECLARAEGFK